MSTWHGMTLSSVSQCQCQSRSMRESNKALFIFEHLLIFYLTATFRHLRIAAGLVQLQYDACSKSFNASPVSGSRSYMKQSHNVRAQRLTMICGGGRKVFTQLNLNNLLLQVPTRSMFIRTQETPNPNSLKFYPGTQVRLTYLICMIC